MNIGVVSLGLIGGSILKALYNKGHKLFAVTGSSQTLKDAEKYTNLISVDMSILSDCDMVFVASPISKTEEVLDKLEHYVNKECIVLDCASVKEFLMKKRPYKFIGSHPMAGTEHSGFSSSFKELFVDAIWVLTPFKETSQYDIEKAKDIISLMGAKPLIANAKEHDNAVALISHLPLLISQSLVYCIKDNQLAQTLAASGFKDSTRLAMSNTQMAVDMMEYNSKNIDSAKQSLIDSLDFLKEGKNIQVLEQIKAIRKKMYPVR